MSTKIICPVCDRAEIEIDTCPNCQTDLSLVRMLTELPQVESIKFNFKWPKWSFGILLISILIGWRLCLNL